MCFLSPCLFPSPLLYIRTLHGVVFKTVRVQHRYLGHAYVYRRAGSALVRSGLHWWEGRVLLSCSFTERNGPFSDRAVPLERGASLLCLRNEPRSRPDTSTSLAALPSLVLISHASLGNFAPMPCGFATSTPKHHHHSRLCAMSAICLRNATSTTTNPSPCCAGSALSRSKYRRANNRTVPIK